MLTPASLWPRVPLPPSAPAAPLLTDEDEDNDDDEDDDEDEEEEDDDEEDDDDVDGAWILPLLKRAKVSSTSPRLFLGARLVLLSSVCGV